MVPLGGLFFNAGEKPPFLHICALRREPCPLHKSQIQIYWSFRRAFLIIHWVAKVIFYIFFIFLGFDTKTSFKGPSPFTLANPKYKTIQLMVCKANRKCSNKQQPPLHLFFFFFCCCFIFFE
jgi:hypothetical protein